jgi:hypothetical protein
MERGRRSPIADIAWPLPKLDRKAASIFPDFKPCQAFAVVSKEDFIGSLLRL